MPRIQSQVHTEAAPLETTADRFRRLLNQWREETLVISDPSDLRAHPAFREIVAMGKDALPFLIEELRREPGAWIAALSEITGENPSLPLKSPTSDQRVEAWLRWGREHGY